MRVGLYIHNKTIKNKFTEGRRSEHESDTENIVTRSHPEQDNDYVLRDHQHTSKGRRRRGFTYFTVHISWSHT